MYLKNSTTDKATNEKNTAEVWDVIMEICDKAGASSKNCKDCLHSIVRRMGHPDPHVALQAITVRGVDTSGGWRLTDPEPDYTMRVGVCINLFVFFTAVGCVRQQLRSAVPAGDCVA